MAFSVTKDAVPEMISRACGQLIFLSAGCPHRPRDGMIAPDTAKAAPEQFVRRGANAIAFLASKDSGFTTGHYSVYGGLAMD